MLEEGGKREKKEMDREKGESFSKEGKAPLSRRDRSRRENTQSTFLPQTSSPSHFFHLSAPLAPSPPLFLTGESLCVPPSSPLLPIPLPFSLVPSHVLPIAFSADLAFFFHHFFFPLLFSSLFCTVLPRRDNFTQNSTEIIEIGAKNYIFSI